VDLTRRQREFLEAFLDLYREASGQPVHYAAVAKRLGIGRVTAYEMLRLLEEKGLVASEYFLPAERGAGRSSILFRPTARAHELISRLAGPSWDGASWGEVKERILNALRAGKAGGYEELLGEILSQLEAQRSPLFVAAHMIAAVILSLHHLRGEIGAGKLTESLRALGFPEEVGLSALGGLMVGLSLVERANRQLVSRLVGQLHRYQQSLAWLSAENKRQLIDFAREVWQIMQA
jgi:hypothetical protein